MQSGYLIDMDGVIHRGGEVIPGARDFIATLQRLDIPFLFLTNNSQRNRLDVATKLCRMGILVEDRHVFTCAIATARFLKERREHPTAYVIGEGGLLSALNHNGVAVVDHDPDFVVVGEGRTLSYEMVEHAVRMVMKGARLIATNLDPSCPTNHGIRPGAGAIVSMIEIATGRKAFSLGKPSPVMMRMARAELGLRSAGITMVGDTMDTDVLGGVQMGYRTVLVLSGGTARADLPRFAYQPDLVVDSVADLVPLLEAQAAGDRDPAARSRPARTRIAERSAARVGG